LSADVFLLQGEVTVQKNYNLLPKPLCSFESTKINIFSLCCSINLRKNLWDQSYHSFIKHERTKKRKLFLDLSWRKWAIRSRTIYGPVLASAYLLFLLGGLSFFFFFRARRNCLGSRLLMASTQTVHRRGFSLSTCFFLALDVIGSSQVLLFNLIDGSGKKSFFWLEMCCTLPTSFSYVPCCGWSTYRFFTIVLFIGDWYLGKVGFIEQFVVFRL